MRTRIWYPRPDLNWYSLTGKDFRTTTTFVAEITLVCGLDYIFTIVFITKTLGVQVSSLYGAREDVFIKQSTRSHGVGRTKMWEAFTVIPAIHATVSQLRAPIEVLCVYHSTTGAPAETYLFNWQPDPKRAGDAFQLAQKKFNSVESHQKIEGPA